MMNELVYEFLLNGRRKKYTKHTIDDYERTVRAFFRYVEDEYPEVTEITEVTREIVLGYEKHLLTRKDCRGNPLSRNRRRRFLSNLQAFFRFLEQEEKLFTNPCARMTLPRARQSLIRDVLTIDEMESLLRSCSGSSVKEARDRAILELLYSTGARAAEICALLVHDIDLSERVLYIRKGKGGGERVVPVGAAACTWVGRYIERARPLLPCRCGDVLFVSMRGRKLQPQSLRDLVMAYAARAGIEKRVTTHTFRHSCATHMLKGRADIRYVQRQLGHKRIATTERYLLLEITDLKEVHERTHPREQDSWEK